MRFNTLEAMRKAAAQAAAKSTSRPLSVLLLVHILANPNTLGYFTHES